jgi:3',5'-cyclic AMP phosphodiesterase CpdA
MINIMTRRDFLGKLAAAFVLLVTGCSRKKVWPISGSSRGTVRLIFYTDVHARIEWETPRALESAVSAINARKADLVVTGGDLITEGFESCAKRVEPRWDTYMKMHRGIKADVYPTIGNHDLVAANPRNGTPPAKDARAVYRTRMGLDQTYYSFNAVGYHFVILDSIQITGDKLQYQGFIPSEELEWLQQDLANVSRDTPVVLATHIPLLTSFYSATRGATFAAPKNRVVVNNRDVFEIIENHNVILVLQGHLHVEELIKWRDTSFIVGGAICGRWWRGPWYGTEEGFNVITLTGHHVEWEYIDYGWIARRP